MDRKQYEEAVVRLEEVTGILKHGKISPEERNRLEREGKELARVVMSPWLPFRWDYRIVMMIIAAIGFWGFSQGNYLFILLWLLLPIFSPRIMGKCIGAITGFKDL
jgi:hypothetical protein